MGRAASPDDIAFVPSFRRLPLGLPLDMFSKRCMWSILLVRARKNSARLSLGAGSGGGGGSGGGDDRGGKAAGAEGGSSGGSGISLMV